MYFIVRILLDEIFKEYNSRAFSMMKRSQVFRWNGTEPFHVSTNSIQAIESAAQEYLQKEEVLLSLKVSYNTLFHIYATFQDNQIYV